MNSENSSPAPAFFSPLPGGAPVLITGGTRSGKSDLALRWAEAVATQRFFVATARPLNSTDEETARRIVRHQAQRGVGWSTVEEPLLLVETLHRVAAECALRGEAKPLSSGAGAGSLSCAGSAPAVVVDCVTMWLANMLEEGLSSTEVLERVRALALWLPHCPLPVVLVTAEVGMGIVPVSAAGRQFRDLQGEANQILARDCRTVVLAACGLPLALKNTLPKELS